MSFVSSEGHAKLQKFQWVWLKFIPFLYCTGTQNDGLAMILHDIGIQFRRLLHIKTCAVAPMKLFESVCIAQLMPWYCVMNVCVGMSFCLQYTHTTPRMCVLRCIGNFIFLGFWTMMKSEGCEFFKPNRSIWGASMWVEKFFRRKP